MGDIWAVEANGVVMEERLVSTNPDPSTISEDYWAVAEQTTQEVVNSIHPTLDAEEKRKDVIDYVQRLIRCSLGFEVFPYGSVPLKTFLPDGDIDLTVLHNPCAEESWVSDVLSVLQAEEQNEYAEYEVKDTQFIDAEVKLVKCLVQNIVIDISFNQMGGLCTLCFLEQVDRLVGKNHLFKRSIILIKAWCYYESRILGAHHGLISTYALETLVLYIFHLFHSSLNGPLAVLYRFLDYFSKFDWDNYCISLNGPVCKSSLPDIVVEMPKNKGGDLFLSKEFLSNSMEMFSVPSRVSETSSRTFLPKHLNIIDPLKEYNNLGRSVHRGNYYRIRSALKHGARKLGKILSLPREDLDDEIKKFFSNTLQSHEKKNRPDTQYGSEGFGRVCPLSPGEVFSEDDMLVRSSVGDLEDSIKAVTWQTMSNYSYSLDGPTVSGHCLNGDDYDLATYSSADFRTSNGTSDCSASSNHSGSFFGQCCQAHQLQLPKPSTENGHFNHINPSDDVKEKMDLVTCLEDSLTDVEMVNNTYQSCEDNWDGDFSCSSAASSPKTSVLESLALDFREGDSSSTVDAEALNPLADLSGDYDSHLRSLLYGQGCLGFALSAPVVLNSAGSPRQSKKLGDGAGQMRSFRSNSFSQTNLSAWESPARIARSYSVFTCEENVKARGTGTYWPNSLYRERVSQGNAMNKEDPGIYDQFFQKQGHSNGLVPGIAQRNNSCSGEGSREVSKALLEPDEAHKKAAGGVNRCGHSNKDGDARGNGNSGSSWRIEFGSIGDLADKLISKCATSGGAATAVEPTSSSNGDKRVSDKSFHLKNEDEFPPLSL